MFPSALMEIRARYGRATNSFGGRGKFFEVDRPVKDTALVGVWSGVEIWGYVCRYQSVSTHALLAPS